ncbi:ubiquitin carboxyl-terminal hydrolase 10-like [Leptinotarsa decemlineata]|uniref:ubiquitin carboxyl-terminal hydrolase 10-like n=1 Tax=Leptinotarsa decemlineata TaxID=7539 RepID=UPI003D30C6B6
MIDFTSTLICDFFGKQLKSSIHRNEDHITEDIQPYPTLPLNIEKVKTVKEALKVLTRLQEQFRGSDFVKNKREGRSKFFEYSHDRCTKIIKTLDFVFDLKIDSTLVSCKTQSPTEKQYKLFAVVYHEGKNANIGHYVTDAFHVGQNCWIRYDDSSLKTVQKEDVLKPQGTKVPYLLFYRKSDMILSK